MPHGVRTGYDRGMGRIVPPLLAALTLGLAPFVPEPHLVSKIHWIIGGAHGMGAIDWFDLVLHGAPWLWLAAAVGREPFRSDPPASGLRRWRGAAVAVAVALALLCVTVAWVS